MTASAITELVRRLDAKPNTALIQTVPVIIGAKTLFARSHQFALRAYGSMFGAGLAWWSGGAANYWGHNAIIRLAAFAAHAGLPELPGKAPFGGHILSHDFIEAALLRRAGWRVELAPDIEGSYEQCPPTLADFTARDRRWAQGNLQHLGVIGARGFDWVSRVHIASGVMGYASSVFWLALIATGVALGYQARVETPNYFEVASLLPTWPVHDTQRALWIIALTAAVVFSPKWLALLVWLAGKLPGWPRRSRFLSGLAVETAVSALTAPLLMVSQSMAVAETLFGFDSGWRTQARHANGRVRVFTRAGAANTMLAGMLVAACWATSPGSAAWSTPIVVSLSGAIPLALILSHEARPGGTLWLITATPEERA